MYARSAANSYDALHFLIHLGVSFLLTSGLAFGQTMEAFRSVEGEFQATLPGKPSHEEVGVGDAKRAGGNQHQFTVAGDDGILLISYQDNPNLAGASEERLKLALKEGRDALKQAFQGEVVEEKELPLLGKYPGLEARLTIPAAKGEARCRLYLVGIRLFQVMAVGTPSFVGAEQTTEVLNSFEYKPVKPTKSAPERG